MPTYPSLFRRFAALCFVVTAFSACAALIPGPKVSVCFSPGGGCLDAAAAEVAKAKTDLRIQAYSLNDKILADAITGAKAAGVKVEIILDGRANTAQNNATFFSTLHGIPTRLDNMHAAADPNVIIIDKDIVITGSFMFTKYADDRNAENMIIIRSAGVARAYLENWYMHRSHAEEFKQAEPQPQEAPKVEKRPRRKITRKRHRSATY